MKNETGGVAIEKFAGSNSKMYSLLVDDSSEHKNTKNVNQNVVGTKSHSE